MPVSRKTFAETTTTAVAAPIDAQSLVEALALEVSNALTESMILCPDAEFLDPNLIQVISDFSASVGVEYNPDSASTYSYQFKERGYFNGPFACQGSNQSVRLVWGQHSVELPGEEDLASKTWRVDATKGESGSVYASLSWRRATHNLVFRVRLAPDVTVDQLNRVETAGELGALLSTGTQFEKLADYPGEAIVIAGVREIQGKDRPFHVWTIEIGSKTTEVYAPAGSEGWTYPLTAIVADDGNAVEATQEDGVARFGSLRGVSYVPGFRNLLPLSKRVGFEFRFKNHETYTEVFVPRKDKSDANFLVPKEFDCALAEGYGSVTDEGFLLSESPDFAKSIEVSPTPCGPYEIQVTSAVSEPGYEGVGIVWALRIAGLDGRVWSVVGGGGINKSLSSLGQDDLSDRISCDFPATLFIDGGNVKKDGKTSVQARILLHPSKRGQSKFSAALLKGSTKEEVSVF